LALICVAALILRLVIVLLGRHQTLNGDGFEYAVQSNFNARGLWFANVFSAVKTPDALHPPLWTLVLTVWAWLGQHSFFAQQILAACIGSLTVGAVGLAGRRIGGARVGLIAAGIAALYPGMWVYERALLSETLLLLGISIIILLGYRFWARPSARSAAVLGIVCGLLALTRSEQILVFVALVAPLILTLRQLAWRRRIAWLALAALGVLVIVSPWTIYNLHRFDHPVLLSNNFGSAVAQGNCAITYYGPLTGSYSLGCLNFVPHGDQSDRNAADLHHGLAYLDHHVARLPVVLFAREGRAFGFWDPFQQVHLDAEWEGNGPAILGASYVPTAIWVNRLALFGFWLLLVPAGAGVFALRRRRIPVYPLLGFFAIVIFTAASTYGEPRYRAAVEVPLVILAAVGISSAFSRRRPAPPSDHAQADRVAV
jgi:4-amino-4-deoxy-L-arabinose transferase-like glycosyltransferase